MRDIEFRALNKHGEFIYGLPYTDGKDSTLYYKGYSNRMCWRNGEGAHCNQPYKDGTLEQYTGLKDKDGTKIFEGDVVMLSFYDYYSNNCVSIEGGETFTGSIKFDNGGWFVDDGEWVYLYDACESFNVERIGNIHENKELL